MKGQVGDDMGMIGASLGFSECFNASDASPFQVGIKQTSRLQSPPDRCKMTMDENVSEVSQCMRHHRTIYTHSYIQI